MIAKETISLIFETARIEEVVGDFVTLKKRGANYLGLCPFHNEKTPSFNVSPVRGIYKCFGCGKGGNSVNFVMEHEQMTYPEALRYLAKKYNIEIEEKEQTPEEKIQQDEKESLFVVSSFAQKHFSDNLLNTDEGRSVGLGYFKERGFRNDIIEKFQLGYAADQWQAFTDVAVAAGHKTEFLVKTGLSIQKENQQGDTDKFFDRFSGRVMFPIHNVTGRVIGFGGRTLKTDKKVAKYVNSPESDIYSKSRVLYGLFFAKKAIIENDNCFLVEGYTDVISLHQSGIENVVSSSGTSLTTEQVRLIKRYTPNITILYDGDFAGIKASFRGIDMVLGEGMNVRVLLFPDGDDPDSYSKKVSPEGLKNFIKENTRDFIAFKAGLLYDEAKNDPIKRAELIKEIVASIALIPEVINRSVYVKECSRIMNMEEQVLLHELNKIRRKNFEEKNKKETHSVDEESVVPQDFLAKQNLPLHIVEAEHQEKDIIRILLHFGEIHIAVEGQDEEQNKVEILLSVAEYILHELQHDEIIFENPAYAKLISELNNYFLSGNATPPPQNFYVHHADSLISSIAIDILSSPYTLANWDKHNIPVKKEEDQLKHSVVSAIMAVKLRRLEKMIIDNQKLIKASETEEELLTLLQEQHALLEAKKHFASQMGRVVIK